MSESSPNHLSLSSHPRGDRHHRHHSHAMRESFPNRGSEACARLQRRPKCSL